MNGRWLIVAPLALLGMTAFIALGGGVVMLLWNWLLPSLFGWPALTFWKALGLLALCRILFGGFGMRGGMGRHRSPEDRARLRHRLRERFGFGAS